MKPAAVWAARLGTGEEGIEGTLELNPGELHFLSKPRTVEFRIPLVDVTHVRRVRGSPVIVVRHGGAGPDVAFYFAKPPPLERPRGYLDRKRARVTAVRYLGSTNRAKRAEVKQWARALKESVGRAG